ncbi:unnamed protein product [Rotaria sp. Silwood2]|nr:unnamed protein product [Rotaria sp. Silwood2]CAF4548975.1 unnamed protein product [Rotaria sp. Silwood2]
MELKPNLANLWWTVDNAEREITFELHIKTTGWIALADGMTGADIGVGWVDNKDNAYFQDRYVFTDSTLVIDNTTIDWFAIQGHEENGWTAIQFKRLLDTCDSMDVPIKVSDNHLLVSYKNIYPKYTFNNPFESNS